MSRDDAVGALDIGGTHVSAGVIDLRARDVENGSRVSLEVGGQGSELLASIVRAASTLVPSTVSRLGVAVPGPFDYGAGVSLIRHKLQGLYGIDLRSELAAAVALPAPAVRFLNDAEAFLVGEWWSGAARGHPRSVGITLGTGLGSAFLAEDRIVRSGPGVPPGGALYEQPFRGASVEESISSRGLLASYGGRRDEPVGVEEVAARAKAGEEAAVRAFDGLGRTLGSFLAPWLGRFEASCLVVGGSIARSWELFGQSLRTELERIETLETVTVAERLEDAPLLGAAWYAGQDE